MAQGLTFTIIFKAMSMNYGESIGNISELKKLNSGGQTFTYISRQALRYELYKCLKSNFNIDSDLNFDGDDNPLHSGNDVIQYRSEVSAANCVEADLFGYMKTTQGSRSVIRPAVVRITPGIALEPYLNDIEFGTNKNFADRMETDPNPFQFEHQLALYSYTVTIDLDRIGVDENDGETVGEDNDKYKRVAVVLDAVQILNREIKGRIENLNPLFAIGGVYQVKNPFFLGRIKTKYDKDKKGYQINTDLLEAVLNLEYSLNGNNESEKVRNSTNIGLIKGYWSNENELKNLIRGNKNSEDQQEQTNENDKNDFKMHSFFGNLKNELKKHYGVDEN